MTDKKPWIAAGIGLLAVLAIAIGLWVFSSSDSEADDVASSETTAVEPSEEPTDEESAEASAEPSPEPTESASPEEAAGGDGLPEGAAQPEPAARELPPEYVTDTAAALENYVPYVGGTMDFGPEVSSMIAPACLPSSYADQNGTELEYSCMSIEQEIVHFGVFDSKAKADAALEGYLAVKPNVHYVYEQADPDNWVILVGSAEALATLKL